MFLRGLSPFGPIFGKELRTASRRRRNYLLRVAYLGGMLLFLFLAWSVTGNFFGRGGVAQRALQQEDLGYYFFAFFSMFCVGVMALVGPVLTSTAINGERAAKTFHVLLMSPLSAWQIVSGKLFSRMLTALTLIGLSLPVLALVRLLGGVELDQMFGVLCLCAVTALFGATLGLFFSILLRRAYAVIILSYLVLIFLYFIAPALAGGFLARTASRMPWMDVLAGYNPFWATGFLAFGQMRMLRVHWSTCVGIHVVASAVLLVISAVVLRKIARSEGEGAVAPAEVLRAPGSLDDANSHAAEAASAAPAVAARRTARTVSDLPVLWRELRRPLMTRLWQRIVAVVLTVGLMLLVYAAAGINRALDDQGFHAFLACCFYTLMLLLTCVIAATSIAQEKEGESWTVLMASPLSGQAIVWGKAIGVLKRLMWPAGLVVGHFLLFASFGYVTLMEFVIAITVIICFNVIWVGTGVAISLRCRKVTVAVIANLALPILWYGVGSIILGILNAALVTDDRLIEQVTWYLPYFYLVEGIQRYDRRQMPGGDGVVSPEWFVLFAVMMGALHVLAALGVLALTARRFDATVGRAPQIDPITPQTAERAVAI